MRPMGIGSGSSSLCYLDYEKKMQKGEAILKPGLIFPVSKLKCLPDFCYLVQIFGVFIKSCAETLDFLFFNFLCVWLILFRSL